MISLKHIKKGCIVLRN